MSALAALMLLLSACGGKSSPAVSTKKPGVPAASRLSARNYRARLKEINKKVSKATKAVTREAKRARSIGALRRAIKRYGDAQLRLGKEVGLLQAPTNAVKANRLLAKAFGDSAREIRAFLPKLSTAKSVRQALGMLQNFKPSSGKELDRAVRELHKLGYSAGS